MKRLGLLGLGILLAAGAMAETAAPPGAGVYIISPAHGEQVNSPVVVKFGLKNMGVAPAGVEKANTGHHHLLIDVEGLPDLAKPIPNDAQYRHFGGGQTEVTLELSSGSHTLRLLLGDHQHLPHQPPVFSEAIHINVQ